jgi:hypothetical protein
MFGIPVWKKDYEDKKHVQDAIDRILRVIKPGDFVNYDACLSKWCDLPMSFAWKLIQWDQKLVFGGNSDFKDIHTTVYFDPDHTFSMEPPKGVYNTLEHYCLEPITIYRYTKREFSPADIQGLRAEADKLIGQPYDIPQLVNILFNTILGFPDYDKIKIFKEGYVCSIAARVIFEHWRKDWNAAHPDKPPIVRLFNSLNPYLNPPGALVQRYHKGAVVDGVEYEMTSPAHFANSAFYTHEFRIVGEFENGEDVG